MEAETAVVLVPLAAQGHLNQLLHLSRLVSAYKIPVHFVSTVAHIRQAKERVHGWDASAAANIYFHEFSMPPFENVQANPNSLNKFPSHLLPLFKAMTNLREPFYELLKTLSTTSRRVVVIYDSMMACAVQDTTSLANSEAYCFQSISAFSVYTLYWEYMGKPDVPPEAEIIKLTPSMEGCFVPEFFEATDLLLAIPKFNSGDIYNTSRVIEGAFLDLLAKEKTTGNDMCWAIGPFHPVLSSQNTDTNSSNKCIQWLDKQSPGSVIFVSFGSTVSLSDEQITKLADGLERSEQKFIWVLRDADKGNIFEGEVRRISLPEGFEERVAGRGLIVRDWAPQLEILGHTSTGGFMSHCGWNSCIESISMGVPIAAWPMHSDQPRNAFLITTVLKIGLQVRDWEHREQVVSSDIVEQAVRRLMESTEGYELRQRATDMGYAVKQSLTEKGVTRNEMDSFIQHITR